MAANWISTDEADDVAGSIRHVLMAAGLVDNDPLAWKWVVIALHSALQGACVCHLTTDLPPIGAVTNENAAKLLNYFEESRTNPGAEKPKSYLMNLPDLLKESRRPSSAGGGSTLSGLTISDSELEWLCRFHDIRNQFVHFRPMGWAIEVSGIPEISNLVARIIREILDFDWAFRHQSDEWREDLGSDLEKLATIAVPA